MTQVDATPVSVIRGGGPIILGQPHSGTCIPEEIQADLNELGRTLSDTDWHVPTLYSGLVEGATIVRANFSRYVVDANRDPSGQSLYPGQNTTGIVPLTTFDGEPIWERPPTADVVALRVAAFHRAYHAALQAEIERVKAAHGIAVLYDCHSIRSRIPYLFDGDLPDFNIGDNDGATCDPSITEAVARICAEAAGYSHVVNGRFKGGWTTRHYGRPEEGVHAVQMELVQRSYLMNEEHPYRYDPARAERLRGVLRLVFQSIERGIEKLQRR
jgi:formiminoglutamase